MVRKGCAGKNNEEEEEEGEKFHVKTRRRRNK
jgi:hypothetical protein